MANEHEARAKGIKALRKRYGPRNIPWKGLQGALGGHEAVVNLYREYQTTGQLPDYIKDFLGGGTGTGGSHNSPVSPEPPKPPDRRIAMKGMMARRMNNAKAMKMRHGGK